MTITAKSAAEALYPRLHPSSIYTMTRSQLRELLLLLPGGELWYSGKAYVPVSRHIGAGVHKLTFALSETRTSTSH